MGWHCIGLHIPDKNNFGDLLGLCSIMIVYMDALAKYIDLGCSPQLIRYSP